MLITCAHDILQAIIVRGVFMQHISSTEFFAVIYDVVLHGTTEVQILVRAWCLEKQALSTSYS